MVSLVEDQKLVVKGINELRKQAGLGRINKLRKGVPLHNRACTLAMSVAGTGIFSGMKAAYVLNQKDPELGDAALRIIEAFDGGRLPELEIPLSKITAKKPGERKQTVIYDPALQGKLK